MSPKFFWSVFFISPSAAAVCELAEPPIILDFRKLDHQSNFSIIILKDLELEVRYNCDTVFFRRNIKNVVRGPRPCRKSANDEHLLSKGSELLVKVHILAHLESRGDLVCLLGHIVSTILGPVRPRNKLPHSGIFPCVFDVLDVS